jgi:hypothetical protein
MSIFTMRGSEAPRIFLFGRAELKKVQVYLHWGKHAKNGGFSHAFEATDGWLPGGPVSVSQGASCRSS